MDPLHRLDLNVLLALHHLLETQSVQQAAAELGVGQPAMSATLGRLRDLLDDPLLIRAGRGLKRTERGEALRVPVATWIAATRALVVPVAPFDPAVDAWTARIAVGDETRSWLAPRLAARVAACAPRIDLRIRRLTLESAREGRQGELDLAVFPQGGREGGPDVSMFVVRPLYDVRWVLATAADHPCTDWDLARYAAAEHVLVVAWDEIDRGFADDLLEERGLTRRIAVTVPTFDEAIALVRGSRRVTLLPETLVGDGIRAHPLPFGERRLRIAYAWHPRATRDPRVRWLRGVLEACFA